MAKYLVIFSDNHNDEFDVNGFRLMTEREVESFEEIANSITFNFDYHANTECLSYANGEDFLSRIEIKLISNEEYQSLKKLFDGQFGIFIGEEYLKTVLDGDDDSSDYGDDTEDEDEDEDW